MGMCQMDGCTFIKENLETTVGVRALWPMGVMAYGRYAKAWPGQGNSTVGLSLLVHPPPDSGLEVSGYFADVSRSTFPVRLLRRFGPGSRPTVSSKVMVLRKRHSTFSKMLCFRADERAFVELSQLKR